MFNIEDRFRDICQKPTENAWVGENKPMKMHWKTLKKITPISSKQSRTQFWESLSFCEFFFGLLPDNGVSGGQVQL